MSGSLGMPVEAYAATLAGFPHMTLARLSALLRHHHPVAAWEVVRGERPSAGLVGALLEDPQVRRLWRAAASPVRVEQVWADCERLGVTVLVQGLPGYPEVLVDDPMPPPVLFALGDLSLLQGRRAGVVGTRNATANGRGAAHHLGQQLASNGVHVVSGLARGIDGHAHRGVLAAEGEGRPLAVVACGLDVVYPAEHRSLWAATADCGLLLTEHPPGTQPAPFRFPQRNRIVAALSEVLVVVESRETGGSLITVTEAMRRDVPVMAVPGPVASRASNGTNALLRDGAAPVLDAGDVLAVLDIDHRRAGGVSRLDARRRPRGADLVVYRVLRGSPRTLDGVVLATGLALSDAAMCLARLTAEGWVGGTDGWFETVGSPLR